MEIKVILYIIAGIIWFLYNSYVAVKKQAKEVKKKILPPVLNEREVISRPQSKVQPPTIERVVRKDKPLLERSRRSESTSLTNSSQIDLTEPFNREQPAFSSTNLIAEPQIENPSTGNLIGQELRNGSFDLQRAVVINELLRPVYL